MREESDDLILKLLGEIGGDIGGSRVRAGSHARELKGSRTEIHNSTHANIRGQAIENEFADLKRHFETLEKAK